METWFQWLTRVTLGDSQDVIARRTGVSRASVGRWFRRERVDGVVVLRVAAAYGADPLEGLIAARWLVSTEISYDAIRSVVKRAPSNMLIEELYARTLLDDM
jgi:transcriptional regulator with XRE-family HTH domain